MLELSMHMGITKIVEFIKKTHVFHGLSDEQLALVAGELQEVNCSSGTDLYVEGDLADSFFLIYSGKVQLFTQSRNEEVESAILTAGDYFGEEALLQDRPRNSSARVADDAVLFKIPQSVLFDILQQFEPLRKNLEISLESRKLARRLRFNWLHENETISFVTRKHLILLWQSLSFPVIAVVFVLFLMIVGFTLLNPTTTWWIAGILFVLILVWGTWNAIDWGNDYYIVTNQRVICLEKIIGIYESRQEAPLENIVSVGVETDAVGRAFGYGNVIVRTFVGRVVLRNINHPHQAAAFVEEQWTRVKEVSKRTEVALIKKAIRSRLFPDQTPPPDVTPEPNKEEKITRTLSWFNNFFKMRFENTSTTTYRKHWFVLFSKIWLPSALIFLQLAILVYSLLSTNFGVFANPDRQSLVGLWFAIFLVVTLWWLYQYLDWSNDIYQVTPDQILDIDKKPLGRETRRVAPLDNILSIEYERVGILGILFNFGNVYITIGGSQMDFKGVFDPASVQDDIDRRRMKRVADKKEEELSNQRERMADWISEYHNSTKVNGTETEENSDDNYETPDPF